MSDDPARWAAVDRYIDACFLPADPVLEQVLRASTEAGLPPINVAPNQGKLLQLIARIRGARRILEIGTLGGYSTIWLARALPADGELVTLEVDPHHAAVARRNIAAAGLAGRVSLRLGAALDTLAGLAEQAGAPFDFVFIDADKEHGAEYFRAALRLTAPGGVIVVDNVIRGGAVVEPAHPDPRVQGTRRLTRRWPPSRG